MTEVIIKRKKQFTGLVVPIAIYINDKFVGTIKSGREARFNVIDIVSEIKMVYGFDNTVKIKTNVDSAIEVNVAITAMKGKIIITANRKHSLEYSLAAFNNYNDTNVKRVHSAFLRNGIVAFLTVSTLIIVAATLILGLQHTGVISSQGGTIGAGITGGLSAVFVPTILSKSVKGKLLISDQAITHSSLETLVRIPLGDIISIRLSKLRIEIKGSKGLIVYSNTSKVRSALNEMIKKHNLIIFMAKVNEIASYKSVSIH